MEGNDQQPLLNGNNEMSLKEEEIEEEGELTRRKGSFSETLKYKLSGLFKPRPKNYSKFEMIRKLPPKRKRHWAWKYEIVRPWEPQPPRNYVRLLHLENPWMLNPPNTVTVLLWLAIFFFVNYSAGFTSLIVNYFIMNTMRDRLKRLNTDLLVFPGWFHIFFMIVAHAAATISIWFLYLTGGMRKHIKRMIPFFLMLITESIWPDVLFSFRWIHLSLIMLTLTIVFCLFAIILFAKELVFSSFLLIFILILHVYHFINLLNNFLTVGMTY